MEFLYIIVAVSIVALVYIILIMPRIFSKPDITPFQGRYYAHRGIHNNDSNCPENSLRAFILAVKQGYGIELDVQLTKDKVPVVFHDYDLLRVCGVDKKVKECTYEELMKYRLFSSKEKIPRLKEVLELVHGRVPLIVELKIRWEVNDTCVKTYDLLKEYKGAYCIESFNPFTLVWFKKKAPHILRGQLSTDYFKDKEEGNIFHFFLLTYMLLNIITRPDFIAYHYIHQSNLSFQIVTKFYRAYAFAWTITNQKDLDEARENFDYFIFDSFIPR